MLKAASLEIDEFCGTIPPKFPSLRSPVEESIGVRCLFVGDTKKGNHL
jgi:hypothetical protein